MDAITLLKNDHKTVEALFKRFEKAGDNALAEKRAVVDQIIEELAIHAAIEEQLFYPVTRATVPETEAIVLESLEEHHIVKWVLSELDSMDPQDERFDAKVTVLIENVRHHVKEEEQEYFPKVRDELGRNALDDLGDAMVSAKAVAPTHPHPRSPDSPPGNLLVGTAAGVVDRVTDTANGIAQGGVTALGDLIATVLRRKKVKRLSVKPGAIMSLQLHHHRAEHWIVVAGTARITRGEETFLLEENQSTYIPLGTKHRIENPGKIPLHMIEVQSGGYLGEDDIVRFEDKYGRGWRAVLYVWTCRRVNA